MAPGDTNNIISPCDSSDASAPFDYYLDPEEVRQYDEKRFRVGPGLIIHVGQVRCLKRLIRHTQPIKVLDIPVGTGRLALNIQKRGIKITGLDASQTMLNHVRRSRHGSGITELVQGSAFQAPFEDGTFDLILSFRLIRHLQLNERQRIYHEMHRLLRVGGIFVFDAVCKKHEFDYTGRRQYSERIFDVLYDSPAELQAELQSLFHVEEIRGVLHFPHILARARRWIPSSRLRRLCDSMVAALDPLLGRFTRNSQEWIVVCRKL